ncbi:hypothetical protein Syun_028064 [Stephania yunnanensis]|uniref:Uncharacterized protein n=1 Tax=Stephania yunnanensis TaxID=152371 RepID=A0AAP0EM86_9MAGN
MVGDRMKARSPNHEKDLDTTTLLNGATDILGDDAPPLRISGPPKPNDGKVADGTAKTQPMLQLLNFRHESLEIASLRVLLVYIRIGYHFGPIGKECLDLWPRIASVANAIV